jgi:hypothetical protein
LFLLGSKFYIICKRARIIYPAWIDDNRIHLDVLNDSRILLKSILPTN